MEIIILSIKENKINFDTMQESIEGEGINNFILR